MKTFSLSDLPSSVDKFLVMDFDGVFNVDRPTGTFPKQFYNAKQKGLVANPDYDKFQFKSLRLPKNYEMNFSAELVNDFNVLANDSETAVLWLTTWRGDMDSVVPVLDFESYNEMSFLKWGSSNVSANHFHKVDAMVEFMKMLKNAKSEYHVVWADDVVLADNFKHPLLNDVVSDERVLTFAPNPKYGLSKDDLVKMKDFLKD